MNDRGLILNTIYFNFYSLLRFTLINLLSDFCYYIGLVF